MHHNAESQEHTASSGERKKDRKIWVFSHQILQKKIKSAILPQVLALGPGGSKPGTRFLRPAFGI
jgi:hypothetical protein